MASIDIRERAKIDTVVFSDADYAACRIVKNGDGGSFIIEDKVGHWVQIDLDDTDNLIKAIHKALEVFGEVW